MQHVFVTSTIDLSENLFLVFKAKSLPTHNLYVFRHTDFVWL